MESGPDCWFQALMLTPAKVAGVQLLPYSLAHHAILSGLESPYSIGGIPDRADLLLAVQVCSRTWEQNRDWLIARRGDIGAHIRWSCSLSRWDWRRFKIIPFDWQSADAEFRVYLEDYNFVPEHCVRPSVDGESTGSEIKAPYEYHIIRILCDAYGMTESEAWNTALNRAKCYADAWAESNGDDTLMSRWDMHVDKIVAEINRLRTDGYTDEADRMHHELQAEMTARRPTI